jgi:hypothetical protein
MRHLLSLAAAVVLAVALYSPAPAADEKIKVLIIDGQNNHDWRSTTPFMKKALEDCGRFSVDVYTTGAKMQLPPDAKDGTEEEIARFKEALLKNFDDYSKALRKPAPKLTDYQVILSNYNGAPWPEAVRKSLEENLKAGKISLVIVHAANNSFTDWGEYNKMIGMGWRGSSFGDRLTLDENGKEKRVAKGQGPGSGHGAGHAFKVVVRDPDHPITQGMPREWMHNNDELYHGMRGPIEHVHLLATSFSDKSKGGTGEHEPMIWTVTYGQGRVFHTPMGHDVNGMRCVGFVATLQRGTEWAATGKVTLPLPSNFPTAEKISLVQAK